MRMVLLLLIGSRATSPSADTTVDADDGDCWWGGVVLVAEGDGLEEIKLGG